MGNETKIIKEGAEITEIELLEPNLRAVDAVQAALEQSGKAAIVHPDGTGKGRIAWRWVAQNPDAVVLWLTPGEQKRRMRLAEAESLGCTPWPERVHLYSCTQLKALDARQWVGLARLRPACVILDGCREFTAVQWANTVQRLLCFCPSAALLGLFSPDQPVRSLDAEELFRDAVVSELSLGQAIAQGLLAAPVVVQPLLRPGKGPLDALRAQIKNLRQLNSADPCERAFAALCRAAEKAGPTELHLARALRPGRVFVLCQSEQAVCYTAMQADVFCGTGARIRTMTDGWDPEQAERFAADDIPGWSLLLCADSAAAHAPLPGVDAAVLVRLDADPAAYRQMMARTLSVCGRVPVYELNWGYEGLAAAQRLRRACTENGGSAFSVTEPFHAAARLARQLQQSLDAQWDRFYAEVCTAHIDKLSELPRSWKSATGLPVGRWLEFQRQIHAGDRDGRLTAEQAAKLEKLGIEWKHRLEQAWNRGFASAQHYRKLHGDLMVPVRFHDRSGFALGEWIVYNRQRFLSGNLSAEREERLQSLGMVWDTARVQWEQSYAAALEYLLENGTLEVPIKYVSSGGLALGVWLGGQRAAYKDGTLTQEQITWLEALDIDWTNRNDRKWQSAYEAAQRYYAAHGNLDVPSEYVDEDGVLLGKWISRQRYAWQNPERSSARVTLERKELLDRIGMIWTKPDSWKYRYKMAMEYKKEHGNLEVPSQYRTEDGIWLGSWVSRQRMFWMHGAADLPRERRQALEELFRGERLRHEQLPVQEQCSVREQNWCNNYHRAKRYFEARGDLLVPASYVDETGFRLGVWVSNLRAARKSRPDSYQVTPEHIALLDQIGMQWDAREAKWQCALRRAAEYRARNGSLWVPVNYKTEDGFCLGDWVRRMHESYLAKDGKLTPDRAAQLEALGIAWAE